MSQEDFAPRKKGIDDFTQDELEKFLHVDLAPDLSPGDLIEEMKEKGYCRIVVDRNFNIYLGVTTHYSMRTSLGNPDLFMDDGYFERRKQDINYNFISGDYGIYFYQNTYGSNLVKAVGSKVVEYVKSIGVQV